VRQSAFRGNFQPNKRPFISFAPDCYVSFQGETTVIGCGECKRKVNYNAFVTQISTEASVDAPPGSATIALSIPNNDKNDFYSDGQFLIIPMMEVEIFAKGYYLVGGVPQYYRIFWGVVQTVTQSWSGGTTSINISCKDILRWWELTNVTSNPAFTEGFGSSAGHYQLFQNQFAGQNPYTTIIQLARDAMGDFVLTTASLNQNHIPEKGGESGVIGSYAKDIMAYWQLKFANIQANLVLFGASGQSYSFSGVDGTVSPNQISTQIFAEEVKRLKQNRTTTMLYSNPKQIATAKKEIARAGDVEFFQNTIQSKLTMAFQARDQIGYEFYCDTTGDIIFKPPFYNLNVLPNKPVSWIQDFDIIDDQISDTELDVVTHATASGNAFGGVMDWALNDEITTPRTGVYDYHLLRRYGWRRAELTLEWAGNPRKLYYHLLDWMDRQNIRRQTATITIPMRPELRMGFPVWIPKYDSFFYINSISHQYSVGGQATTVIQLTAKRSKFIAPSNIGRLEVVKDGEGNVVTSNVTVEGNNKDVTTAPDPLYKVSWNDSPGSTAGLSNDQEPIGVPAIIRDPNTGKILGFPNAVMVYRSTFSGAKLAKVLQAKGKDTKNTGKKKAREGVKFDYDIIVETLKEFQSANKGVMLARIRAHRYEAGMSSTGAYDYAHDVGATIKELSLVPATNVHWGPGSEDPNKVTSIGSEINELTVENPVIAGQTGQTATNKQGAKEQKEAVDKAVKDIQSKIAEHQKSLKEANAKAISLKKQYDSSRKKVGNKVTDVEPSDEQNAQLVAWQLSLVEVTKQKEILAQLSALKVKVSKIGGQSVAFSSLNILVRPVSDEFGFEVIGHYRYGRGSFLDRGKIQVQTDSESSPNQIANRLNIQFAPTGGLITESITGIGTAPEITGSVVTLEQMQPDDWRTGATFSPTILNSLNGGIAENEKVTSDKTYSENLRDNAGTSVYIEADAVRRAKTLAEMNPTVEIPGFSDAYSDACACGIGRNSWFSVLPKTMIREVLGAGFQPGNTGNDPESALSKDFFTRLDVYLVDQFNKVYTEGNARREEIVTGRSRNIASRSSGLFIGPEQDNVLGAPGNPLFDRAALGDPDALKALENQANFNFGLSSDSLSNFKQTAESSRVQIRDSNKKVTIPESPTLSSPINKSKFDFAGATVYTNRKTGEVKKI